MPSDFLPSRISGDSLGPGVLDVPSGLSNVVAIAAGYGHMLTLRDDWTMIAWGGDFEGANVPTSLSNVVAITAGNRVSLALKANGTVVSWGLNNLRQTDVPAGLSNVVAIAADDLHSMALKADGTIVAWGGR